MIYDKTNTTILYTYWDTPEEQWRTSLESAKKTNLNIVIVNDQSSESYYNSMLRIIDELCMKNVTIYTPDEKLLQSGATFFGVNKIYTPFVIRMDSDDIILEIPKSNEESDIVNSRKNQPTNLNDILCGKNPSINGSIVKTEILKIMYKDYEYQNNHHLYWHEDLFTIYRLFLLTDVKIIPSLNKKYKQVLSREHKLKPKINKKIKRIEVLLAVALRINLDIELYYKYSKIIWEHLK